MKTAFRPRPTSGKWGKLCFGRGRRAENGKNCVSAVAEEQKTGKTGRRRPTKDEKRKKMFIVGRRNTESSNFYSSSADETKNTAKTARRRATKRRITQFSLIVGRRNAESPKNCVSSMDDERKTANSAFHPRMKSKKREKQRFRRGGKSESPNFRISARAENQKQIKTARRRPTKRRIVQFLPGAPSDRVKNGKKTCVARERNAESLNFWQFTPVPSKID